VIIETLKYGFHSFFCPRYIKKLGLLSDLIGIESRYSRCKQDWKPHLENTKRVIIKTAQGLKKHDSVIIFGAGSLHDVPLKELSALFREVHLVDIIFLQGTINEIKRYSNVEFHELDITGVLKKAQEWSTVNGQRSTASSLETIKNLSSTVPKHFVNDHFDLVISLNLLSQLPMAIKNYIEKKLPLTVDRSPFTHFYRSLILNHLISLESFASSGSQVLLISDTQKQVSKNSSEALLTESSLEGSEENIFQDWKAIDEWIWVLAPNGELEKDYALNLRVKAFKI
jgi:hypothetical protein